ncbi:patellin-4 [Curcuma longa]|uniref:patellin-4 n=1 Tax=Curcuma longa TaxID=136217 RepID=UPI003D9E3964
MNTEVMKTESAAPEETDPVGEHNAVQKEEKEATTLVADGEKKADDAVEEKTAAATTVLVPSDEKKLENEDKEPEKGTEDAIKVMPASEEKKPEKEMEEAPKVVAASEEKKADAVEREMETANEIKEKKSEAAEKETEVAVKVVAALEEKKPAVVEKEAEEEATAAEVKNKEGGPVVEKASSFREESNFLSDLKESERKALVELRAAVEEAILENKLFRDEPESSEGKKDEVKEKVNGEGEKLTLDKPAEAKHAGEEKAPDLEEKSAQIAASEAEEQKEKAEAVKVEPETVEEKAVQSEKAIDEEVTLWGVPLLPSNGGDHTDVILLKFLRARDFKVKDAFQMLKNVLRWRKESNIDSILDEEVESSVAGDLAVCCYMDGVDREDHPICYNVSGVFQNDALYLKTFGSEEGRERFLRWRVRLMEEGIRLLDFKPGGVASLLQITDLKNSPGPGKKELRTTMKQVVQLFQDNYPEFVARNIFINVPFWYYAFNALISPFLTQRTKSKFVFARPSKVSETLLKHIPAEALPVRYGGLKRENDTEFSVENGEVSELILKSSSTETVEIPIPEAGSITIWDLSVLGWEVNYKEEFVPTDEGSYTIVVKKGKKLGPHEEPMRNSFRNNEPGTIVLTIENTTFWKKKVLYRYKVKSQTS